ncbi:phosphatase PAP2 family protein [Virgisporangium ochraceum]|uniref:phosphatase PAP2 family protein n=1 Tax=Virgisporangium ochraceum TaxID=65505 RepID=UPI001945B302|nr:phosphatase PAP2 family protein [Virgisporangium ochraceum]
MLRIGQRRKSWWHRLRLRPRLALAALAAFLVAVPVTLLALAVRNGWGPMKRLDLAVADALHDAVGDQRWLLDALHALDVILHPWVFRGAVLVAVLVLVTRGAWRLAWWAAITMTTGSVLGLVLKLVVARSRPSFDLPLATAPGYSFPSGHALNSTVGVLVLLLVVLPALPTVRRRVAAWAVGLTLILLTGFDRVGLGVHYVSDVVAAWLVGIALVVATAAAFETWRRDVGRPAHDPLAGVAPEEVQR